MSTPLYLPAPQHDPRGPDGRGWNRLRIESIVHDQCALQPHSYPALWEMRYRRAHWGYFGPCTSEGACGTCPIAAAAAQPTTMDAFTDQVLVRLLDKGTPVAEPHLMNHPEKGWSSSSRRVSWRWLARLEGWRVGRRHVDQHGEGFWLEREAQQ